MTLHDAVSLTCLVILMFFVTKLLAHALTLAL